MSVDAERSAEALLRETTIFDRGTEESLRGTVLRPLCAAGQSQRLADVGLMSAGIAHDLGNLMQIIEAGLRGMHSRFGADTDEGLLFLHGEVAGAARRASEMARRVLDHARGSSDLTDLTDIGAVILNMRVLIGWAAGPDVRIVLEVKPGLPAVRCSPGELERALINLVVNARHAMPDGGALTISVTGAPGGVALRVGDTGCGMSKAAALRACEPLMTTRAASGGTGLGLAIVGALMRELGGTISVQSAPGRGATVSLHFVTD